MASDGDTQLESPRLSKLIVRVQNMLRRPQVNNDLSEALDDFMRELTINNHYLRNGIFTMKFAEIGIFLQLTVDMYSKQVDLLWEDTLHYHVQLCSYNQSSNQNALEAEVITERINRNKRKKIVRQIVQNSVLSQNLLDDLERSFKVLQACESITKSDALKNAWKETNKSECVNSGPSVQNDCRKSISPLTNFQFSTYQSVQSLNGEKLGNYDDLFLNHVTPYLGSLSETTQFDSTSEEYNNDFLLQRYLKHKGIPYKKFCMNKLGEDFNFFKKRIRQIETILPAEALKVGLSNASIANLSPLTEELMTEHSNENDDRVRTMIHEHLLKERQGFASRIKKSSERISDVDSAFQDECFMDTESRSSTPIFTSQQSNVDSGIFESDLQDQYPVTSSDSSLGCCISENNVSNCINGTPEDIIEENINTDNIPQDNSILNSTNNMLNLPETDTVESSPNNNAKDCPAESQVVSREECTEQIMNININRPAPVPITSITFIKPLVQNNERVKAQKRKILNSDNNSSPVKQRRVSKFKWLKTTTATLKKFEKFFLQNYVTEDDEADPNREIYFEDDSEDEADINGLSTCEDNNDTLEEVSEELIEVSVVQDILSDLNGTTEVPLVSNDITQVTSNVDIENSDNESINNDEDILNNDEDILSSALEIETTNRMKAVNEWRSFIEPKLKRMEKSSEFDIHAYGSQIMDSIPEGQNLAFKNLVSKKSSSDVCKLFLASLQLANTGNIEIISSEQGRLANDSLKFKLLTRERYHEYLDEYEAPSENSFRERLERVKASYPGEMVHSTPKILNYSKRNNSRRLRLS